MIATVVQLAVAQDENGQSVANSNPGRDQEEKQEAASDRLECPKASGISNDDQSNNQPDALPTPDGMTTAAAAPDDGIESSAQSSPPALSLGPAVSSKRRSSWRYLLSPSYKSRSEEFHKLFADELPKTERLIADYSCALHREILLQGRLYVSINYLAFYSNIFSWITKLVVRLSDIRDIHKANTAKIIPNAIQIITDQAEKHVFASFIARDKSYMLIWRIWRNCHLTKERLSDQELRKLVHLGYGKDLGFSSSDLEEQQMLMSSSASSSGTNISPLSCEPAATRNTCDDNNNQPKLAKQTKPMRLRFKSRSQNQKEVLSLIEEATDDDLASRGLARNGSIDLSRSAAGGGRVVGQKRARRDRVVRHLSMRLANLSSLNYHDDDQERRDVDGGSGQKFCPEVVSESKSPEAVSANNENKVPSPLTSGGEQQVQQLLNETNGSSSTSSSAVVVDTPVLMPTSRSHRRDGSADDLADAISLHELAANGGDGEQAEQILIGAAEQATNNDDQQQVGVLPAGGDTPAPLVVNEDEATPAGDAGESARQGEREVECGCQQHEGALLVDEQFDIDVDILFSLIFTNSKFMRAWMIRRGQTRSSVSKWRRGAASSSTVADGNRSNSSTLSSRDSSNSCQQPEQHHARQNSFDSLQALDRQAQKVQCEQERLLSYSMNVNHVLAKQVHVEERQNICRARAGSVYVLKSRTINSGFPYSESFTIDLTYCLTRGVGLNEGGGERSRMQVHGLVNFIKEKHSWRVSMVKSVLEKSSMQEIREFLNDLSESIRKYVAGKRKFNKRRTLEQEAAPSGGLPQTSEAGDDDCRRSLGAATPTGEPQRCATRESRLLTRAKSKLKERKLRNMYKYHIQNAQVGFVGAETDHLGDRQRERRFNKSVSPNSRRGASKRTMAGDDDDDHDNERSQSHSPLSSPSSSSASSLSDANDDNDSMVMMMATTNDEGDDEDLRGELLEGRPRQNACSGPRRAVLSSTPTMRLANGHRLGKSHDERYGQRQSYVTTNLVVALGGGLLLLLTVVVFIMNALVLRRLDRLESILDKILTSQS